MMKLGILAGKDYLPLLVAKEAQKEGKEIAIVSLIPQALPDLETVASAFAQISVGELDKIISFLKTQGVQQVVMAGKVTKEVLYSNLVLDQRALTLLASLKDRNDDTILLALVGELAKEGLEVISQTTYLEKLLPQVGVLSQREPNEEEWRDIRYGQKMAREIAGLDIGQTVVVKKQAVMAIEAIEGTDAAIRRGGALGQKGSVVVKVSKPQQDLRFDIPTVGMNTLNSLIEAQCSVLAIEAGKTFFLQQEELLAKANRAGISIVAF